MRISFFKKGWLYGGMVDPTDFKVDKNIIF
nr:MAG TPA: PHR domain protein [Bacteriophage sp.]